MTPKMIEMAFADVLFDERRGTDVSVQAASNPHL
jgi:hypothetical protein